MGFREKFFFRSGRSLEIEVDTLHVLGGIANFSGVVEVAFGENKKYLVNLSEVEFMKIEELPKKAALIIEESDLDFEQNKSAPQDVPFNGAPEKPVWGQQPKAKSNSGWPV